MAVILYIIAERMLRSRSELCCNNLTYNLTYNFRKNSEEKPCEEFEKCPICT